MIISVQFKMITYSKVNRVTIATNGKDLVIETYCQNYGGQKSGHSIWWLNIQFLYSWTSVAWNQMAWTPSISQILSILLLILWLINLNFSNSMSNYFNEPIIINKLLELSITPNTFCQSLQVWTIKVQLYAHLMTYTVFLSWSIFFSRWKSQCVYELFVCFWTRKIFVFICHCLLT